MNKPVDEQFKFPGQTSFYRGSVRDVYTIGDTLVMVASDRVSTFDVLLPVEIPYKGQVLNKLAVHNLKATKDVVPNWFSESPHPNVSIGTRANPYKVEMVIRGYLTGHSWRVYRDGGRELCGVTMPDDLKEHDKFPEPIITPAAKAEEGHDEDISREEIIKQGIVGEEDYEVLEEYTRKLYAAGTKLAAEQGLILVDTKYEFGKTESGEIILIDEVHTPDSSRYFYSEGYAERQANGEPQKQLSKEFVREWLIDHGFMGKDGQEIPDIPESFIKEVSERYIELYEQLTGETFEPVDTKPEDIEKAVLGYLGK